MSTHATVGRARAPWGRVIGVTIGIAVVFAGLLLLMFRGQAQGTAALDLVKEHAAAGLAREQARLEARGESLEVVWSTVPMPRGDGDSVVGRLEARPSGSSREAVFMVMGDEVTSRNALARRLLATGSAGASGGTMTMDDGMQMPMPE